MKAFAQELEQQVRLLRRHKGAAEGRVEHIHPSIRDGSDCVSNLTLPCRPCNQAKDNRFIQEFLAHGLARRDKILSYTKKPPKNTAAVNATTY